VKDAARGLEWSETKIWRIETGQTSLRSFDVEVMCRVYGVQGDMTAALMGLAKETKARGWWQAYGDAVPEWFDLYVGLEAAASKLFLYEQDLVPGLFQVPDYARTLITADHPDESDEDADRRVGLRMARQALVRHDRPARAPGRAQRVRAEAPRRRRGSDGRAAAAAGRGIGPSERIAAGGPVRSGLPPGHRVRLVQHAAVPLNGGGQESEPPTVYADLYTGALYLDKPNEIERYAEAFAGIWQHALGEEASREMILEAAEALTNG
jgi:Domain of unknown function (DUF5753)/Helix-turn-helix domain